jgi:hypothetical protein
MYVHDFADMYSTLIRPYGCTQAAAFNGRLQFAQQLLAAQMCGIDAVFSSPEDEVCILRSLFRLLSHDFV